MGTVLTPEIQKWEVIENLATLQFDVIIWYYNHSGAYVSATVRVDRLAVERMALFGSLGMENAVKHVAMNKFIELLDPVKNQARLDRERRQTDARVRLSIKKAQMLAVKQDAIQEKREKRESERFYAGDARYGAF